jgi:hypothetical protein
MSMLTWKKPVLLSLGSLVLFATAANADVVRIVSVDGSYNPNHVSSLYVRAGDLVELDADLVNSGNFQPDNYPAQDFVWSASLVGTSFQYTNVGVNFVVPYGNWEIVTVYVASSLGNYGEDDITLINENFVAPTPYPPRPLPPQPPRPLPPRPQPPMPQPPRPAPQPPRPGQPGPGQPRPADASADLN